MLFVKFLEALGVVLGREFQWVEGNSSGQDTLRGVDPISDVTDLTGQMSVQFVAPASETRATSLFFLRQPPGRVLPMGDVVEESFQFFQLLSGEMS